MPNDSSASERSSAAATDACLVDALAEEYLSRLRHGERPAIDDYTAAHPDLADEIRDVFRTLAMLEDFAPDHREDPPTLSGAAPTEVGEYRVIRELGRGGMGVVYEAEHLAMRRRVALKVLHARPSHKPHDLERFQREARAAGRLHHTNIVPVFEVGVDGETHFYAMQCIRGQNLDLVIADLRQLQQGQPGVTKQPADAPSAAACLMSGCFRKSDVASRDNGQTTITLPAVASRRPDTSSAAAVDRGRATSDSDASDNAASDSATSDSATSDSATSDSATSDSATSDSATSDRVTSDRDATGSGTTVESPFWSESAELSRMGHAGESFFHRVARIGAQVADALAYAHEHGILHRDIKPANLILDTEGTVWVTDFGLARSDEDDLTNTGDIVGTLRYMAPERLKGRADGRSDVYSLGLTLYELCTLRYAFDSVDRSDLIRQVNEPVILRPRQINAAIPRDLETIILKCLTHDPAGRYATAEAVAEDLRRFVADRPILARRASLTEQTLRWMRRNPVLGGLLSTVCLLLTIVVAGAIAFAVDASRQATRLEAETDRARAAQRGSLAAHRQAQQTLYESFLNQARASRWSGRQGQRYETLLAVQEATALLPTLSYAESEIPRQRALLRSEALAALPLVDVHQRCVWPAGTRARCTVSRDGSRVASCDAHGLVSVFDGRTGAIQQQLQGPDLPGWRTSFSHDGSCLAMLFHPATPARDFQMRVWQIDTGELLLAVNDRIDRCILDFDPTGRLVYLQEDRQLYRWDPLTGQSTVLPTLSSAGSASESSPGQLTILEDGRLLLAVGTRVEIRQTVESIDPADVITFPSRVHHFVVHKSRLAAACTDDNAYLHNLQTGQRQTFTGHLSNVTSVRFANNGKLLLTGSWDERLHVYDTATGERRLQLEGYDLAQGQQLITDRLHLTRPALEHGIWDFASGDAFEFLDIGATTDLRDVAAHPSRPEIIAVAGSDLSFWNAASQTCLARFPVRAFDVEFTADGRTAYVGGVGRDPCYRCDVSAGDEGPVTIGRPQPQDQIPAAIRPGLGQHLSLDASGHRLAIKNGSDEVVVVDLTTETVIQRLTGHPARSTLSLSPDGSRLVTGAWHGTGVRVWEVDSGESVDLLPDSGNSWSRFSADGKWLITTSEAGSFRWDTTTWTRLKLPDERFDNRERPVTLSPDSRLALLSSTRYVPRLVDVTTGTHLGLLQAPVRGVGFSTFSCDGRWLYSAVGGSPYGGVRIWDFAAVKDQLTAIGLPLHDLAESPSPQLPP